MEDGTIDYLGRNDFQVKIRGFRIELGEIETALKEHLAIRDAVVSVRDADGPAPRLVGYIILNEGNKLGAVEIKGFLQSRLPDYMIPGTYVTLETFPLTPSGKIDRKALPEPETMELEGHAEYQEARDEVEKQLVVIWEELLGARKIGINDGFFDLGGHSLLAAQLAMRIEKQFGRSIPLATLLESPTIEAIAKIISYSDNNTAESRPKITSVPREARGTK
ncbi:MAG: phosphopantetheine-binding protein [Cyclobacteriaceae bacterium]